MTVHLQLDRWICIHWQTDTRSYTAEITQDLWGNWLVTRHWGSRRTQIGNRMVVPAQSYEDALSQLEQVSKRRRQRGYKSV